MRTKTLLLSILLAAIGFCTPGFAAEGLRPPNHGVYVIAHRGAHIGIPENTLAAARKAIELGADFVEIDVRTTKDGKLVLMHNGMVDAYTNGAVTGPVKDFTLEEIKALDIGSRVGPEWKDERVPTYEEMLDVCKGKIGIYLDVKDATVEDLLPPIVERGMQRDVVWYGGPALHTRVQKACPECFPMPDPGPEKFLPKLIERFKPQVIAAVWDEYTESFVATCHAAGALVFVDEDDATSWEPALAWGSDGIQTDDPEGLIDFLKARKAAP
ncbi:MAG: glycerophosphodiester phosphodiesterase [Candidatus Hydrogenedens sp.]|nr:glycerophosphodiester phosphodiesterase [Candidatus Hydrogenedens sp.]